MSRKNRSNGGNGSAHQVGSQIALGPGERKEIEVRVGVINDLQRQIGALEEEYQQRRAALFSRLSEERRSYLDTLRQKAVSLGVDVGPTSREAWSFNPLDGIFTRTT